MTVETIRANAVGRLGEQRVGVGNIYERVAEDTSSRSGLSAQLFPAGGESLVVWPGDVVELGGARWSVTAVVRDEDDPGSVTLQRTT